MSVISLYCTLPSIDLNYYSTLLEYYIEFRHRRHSPFARSIIATRTGTIMRRLIACIISGLALFVLNAAATVEAEFAVCDVARRLH